MSFSRYAVYYMPCEGDLARFGGRWLGWDAVQGCEVPQPVLPGIEALTRRPRKYGFHGTLKPPFRLAEGCDEAGLAEAVAQLAARTQAAQAEGLALTRIGRFFALTLVGDQAGIARVAAACVQELDAFRAEADAAELEKRRKARLSPAQEGYLQHWGYPYVLEEFRFHLTLTGPVERGALDEVEARIAAALPEMPTPFDLDSIALVGERADGRFELIQSCALTG